MTAQNDYNRIYPQLKNRADVERLAPVIISAVTLSSQPKTLNRLQARQGGAALPCADATTLRQSN
jgi:hypothetical protein